MYDSMYDIQILKLLAEFLLRRSVFKQRPNFKVGTLVQHRVATAPCNGVLCFASDAPCALCSSVKKAIFCKQCIYHKRTTCDRKPAIIKSKTLPKNRGKDCTGLRYSKSTRLCSSKRNTRLYFSLLTMFRAVCFIRKLIDNVTPRSRLLLTAGSV